MKKISIFLIVSLFLFTSFTFADAQGLTFGREKLKGTDKIMGDYKKPTTPTTTKRLTCSNCICDCTVADTTSTAPTTPAPTTKAATGMGTTGGGGTSRPK
jgi:hypothetical protein